MKKYLKGFVPVTLAATMVLAACGEGEEDEADTGADDGGETAGENGDDTDSPGDDTDYDQYTLEDGKFVFALSGEYRPFSYDDGTGDVVGFDVDIGMAIAEELGLEGVPHRITWNSIILGLNDNRYDAIIGSMGITEERKENVAFSDPYYYSGAQVFARSDSDIQSLEDIDENTEVAVAEGTTYHTMIQDYTENTVTYDSDVVALQTLSQGRHDAVVTDRLVGLINIEDQELDIELRGDLIDTEEMAIALRHDEDELMQGINEALEALHESGKYEEINQRYFDENIGED
ncbi:transporter substrate-binding domain-containing protein [Alteribacter natronophilus]|uniref:transporter substrate-binding domain-containing protein n=1 Tax=Alteribacter natronophilus TaxID=2583810 RepID=UPI00110E052C|nr:transporter substrate-binding domain-containing protein [Alteribacter natronophilus]TMW71617.1 transporter substrate-binding domain-containing protein [Alteribacter natronophilus]